MDCKITLAECYEILEQTLDYLIDIVIIRYFVSLRIKYITYLKIIRYSNIHILDIYVLKKSRYR